MPRAINFQEYPVSPSTQEMYEGHLTRLRGWLKGREITDETVAEYLKHQFDKGLAPANGQGVLSAVRWWAFNENRVDPRGRLCETAMKNFNVHGAGRGRGQVDGLTWEQVDAICALATKQANIYGLRDAAIICCMSDGLLRIGECSASDVEHLNFQRKNLHIPRSKTDQDARGAYQWLRDRTLEYLRIWLEKGKVNDGPLFRPIHNHYTLKRRLKTDAIRKIIKQRCRDAGFEGRFSGHSLRVGSAQEMARGQATLPEMQDVGRWKSPNMPAHYAKGFSTEQSPMARLRG